MGHNDRIESGKRMLSIECGAHSFGCFEFLTLDSRGSASTAVAVAAIYKAWHLGVAKPYEDKFMYIVQSAVADVDVSFAAGLFTCPRRQVEALCSSRDVCARHPFCQWWWLGSAQEEEVMRLESASAVAGVFRLSPSHVCHMCV